MAFSVLRRRRVARSALAGGMAACSAGVATVQGHASAAEGSHFDYLVIGAGSVRSFIRNDTGPQRSRSYRQVPNSTPNPKLP